MRLVRRYEIARFAVMLVLLAACFLWGGASRLDVLGLLVLQPLAAICAAAFLLIPRPISWTRIQMPLFLLAALAVTMAVQLVPLPPDIWTNLPGHEAFAETARAAGIQQPWRTISLTPDLTLASLVSLVVPMAVLIGVASLDQERRYVLLTALVAGGLASACFGLAQIAGGPQSPFYLYDVTNLGSAVGLFANRNHQALLIAMMWPMLAVWTMARRREKSGPRMRIWLASSFAIFLLPLLLVTGSRAGVALAVVGMACAFFLLRNQLAVGPVSSGRLRLFALSAAGLSVVLVLVAAFALSKDEAIRRLVTETGGTESRAEFTPVLIRIAADFFPVGSGFGSFDPVYSSYEPLALLRPEYLNHAHNDLLEFIITGGLPAFAILGVFLGWQGFRGWRAWRSKSNSRSVILARLGSGLILLVLLSSLVDYPLRTPIMAAIFAIACAWLGGDEESRNDAVDRRRGPKDLYP